MFRRADYLLLGVALVLTLFGLAMVSSVSVFESYQLTTRFVTQGLQSEPSNAFYLWRSFLHVVVGLFAMLMMSVIPYRLWERYARTIFLLSMGCIVLLFIPGLGNSYGTARSWLHLGPFNFQPSEFFKLSFIFYLAVWLQKRESDISTFKEGFIPFCILLCLSTFLVAMQPDLGSFLIFSAIGVVMFFIAGGNIFHLILGASAAGVLGLPIILNEQYVRNRFLAFLNPSDPSISEGIGFQIKQALIAIGSGGLFGVGYGKSIQKFGYLPEVQSDTIFAAMAEELGFMRLLIVMGLFAVLIYRGYVSQSIQLRLMAQRLPSLSEVQPERRLL
jgi:cell division protein FtsW